MALGIAWVVHRGRVRPDDARLPFRLLALHLLVVFDDHVYVVALISSDLSGVEERIVSGIQDGRGVSLMVLWLTAAALVRKVLLLLLLVSVRLLLPHARIHVDFLWVWLGEIEGHDCSLIWLLLLEILLVRVLPEILLELRAQVYAVFCFDVEATEL